MNAAVKAVPFVRLKMVMRSTVQIYRFLQLASSKCQLFGQEWNKEEFFVSMPGTAMNGPDPVVYVLSPSPHPNTEDNIVKCLTSGFEKAFVGIDTLTKHSILIISDKKSCFDLISEALQNTKCNTPYKIHDRTDDTQRGHICGGVLLVQLDYDSEAGGFHPAVGLEAELVIFIKSDLTQDYITYNLLSSISRAMSHVIIMIIKPSAQDFNVFNDLKSSGLIGDLVSCGAILQLIH